MPTLNHIHRYIRYKGAKNNPYYKCDDPHCTHYTDRKMLIGKASRCECGREFILTAEDLQRARPKCLDCSNTIRARKHKIASLLAKNVLSILENVPKDNELERPE